MDAREGMGLGQEEAGQSLGPGDEVNRRQAENPRERPHRLASRLLILVMENKTPKAFLCQGLKPKINALLDARTQQAYQAEETRSLSAIECEPEAAQRCVVISEPGAVA